MDRLLLGTRKGLIVVTRTARGWEVGDLLQPGVPIAYACRDPRDGVWWASEDHGHWGTKLARSRDEGVTWERLPAPKYPDGATWGAESKPASLELIWVIQPGPDDRPGRIYLGTNPGGLFVRDGEPDPDDTTGGWRLVTGLWEHPSRPGWFGGGRESPGIHSVVVHPRDSRVLWVAVSCAGVFRSDDEGASWRPTNKGLHADFLPDPDVEVGFDPHLMVQVQGHPDVIWQQNHCGVFVSRDAGVTWQDVSETGAGRRVRFGFPIAVDHAQPDVAWVVPGHSDGQRTTVDGALRVCRTDDGGRTWKELTAGLPARNAWDVVYRHALDVRGDRLAFGSTTGNAYVSEDRGESWSELGHNLPPVYSVRFA